MLGGVILIPRKLLLVLHLGVNPAGAQGPYELLRIKPGSVFYKTMSDSCSVSPSTKMCVLTMSRFNRLL